MLRLKLIGMAKQIKPEDMLLKRLAVPHICCASRHDTNSRNANKNTEVDELDEPIKYSTSPASSMKAGSSYTDQDVSIYKTLIIGGSLAVFCIYFGILREENDIDQKMTADLSPEMKDYIYGIRTAQQRHKQTHKSPIES